MTIQKKQGKRLIPNEKPEDMKLFCIIDFVEFCELKYESISTN